MGRREGSAMKPQSKLYDPDTERQLVGAALLDPALFANTINPSDFYLEDLRAVWQTGRELIQRGLTPDQVTLADALERKGAEIRRSFIASLVAENLSTGYVESWAATVREYAQRRRVFAVLQEGLVAAQNGADIETAIDGVLNGLERLLDDEAQQRRAAADTARSAKSLWAAAELIAAAFDGPRWAIKDLLPIGLTLLTGEALAGKSWLALQLATAAATSGTALDRRAEAGRVLYLAPDDGPRRLQERAVKQGMPRDAEISFATEWRAAGDPVVDLERVIREGHYRLVVLDTLSSLCNCTGDAAAQAAVIRHAALDAGTALLMVDRPAVRREILDRVSCDAALTLERTGPQSGVLHVTGRDVEPQELALDWQPATCTWQLAEEPGLARDRR
jgi:hypothetical protein